MTGETTATFLAMAKHSGRTRVAILTHVAPSRGEPVSQFRGLVHYGAGDEYQPRIRNEARKLKAMVLHALGQPLVLEDRPMPAVGPADVLVRVRACGIGLTVVNLLATPGRVTVYPRIPGHEIAGDVVEVGVAVHSVTVGKRVTNHFYLTCGQCKQCRAGRETLCLHQRGNIGAATDGGY